MTQQSGNQYDDDLTVGMDNDDSFSTDSIDLFQFSGDDESPIAKLKAIILSIDWEINDDILQQLDDELLDLGDVWAGDKIKQVYIQGLHKIGRYIYREKANAHPNAIKLLITFFHNLEKISSSEVSMSEDDKKRILLEDVRKFDRLKSYIASSDSAASTATDPAAVHAEESGQVNELKVLKAQVLGIDWEVNESELQTLAAEVKRLQGLFREDKPKQILLQGIGALASYIDKKRATSNSKAFPLLHSFYGVLEEISSEKLSAAQQKKLLLAEVDKFNSFKQEIAQSMKGGRGGVAASTGVAQEEPDSMLPVDQSNAESQVASAVDSRLASVFGEVENRGHEVTDESVALEGVNVETEADDDSDEDALPVEDGAVAPALAEAEKESSFSVERLAGDLAEGGEKGVAHGVEDEYQAGLSGVDVESEADDESAEDALPVEDGEIAPALVGASDSGGFDEGRMDAAFEVTDTEDLDNRLDSFFDDEVQSSSQEWNGAFGRTPAETASEEVPDRVAEADDDYQEVADGLVGAASSAPEWDFLDAEDLEEEGLSPAVYPAEGPDSEPVISDGEMGDLRVDKSTVEGQPFDDDEVAPALSGIEDSGGFDEEQGGAGLAESAGHDLEQRLDDFFGDEGQGDVAQSSAAYGQASPEQEQVVFLEAREEKEIPEVPAQDVSGEGLTAALSNPDGAKITPRDGVVAPAVGEYPEDDIEFTIPGEKHFEGSQAIRVSPEDSIEFEVPGEAEAALGIHEMIADPASLWEGQEGAKVEDLTVVNGEVAVELGGEPTLEDVVIFEAVADSVAIDPLPGEVFADGIAEEGREGEGELSAQSSEEGGRSTGPKGKVLVGADYHDLGECLEPLGQGYRQDAIQDLLAQINALRGSGHVPATEKIFLQLLSTVSQHLESTQVKEERPESSAQGGVNGQVLVLLKDIYSGLRHSVTSDSHGNGVQEQLLLCTSQTLLLLQQEIRTAKDALSSGLEDGPPASRQDDQEGTTGRGDDVSGGKGQANGSMAEELTDIKKLFLAEITTLRKEFLE